MPKTRPLRVGALLCALVILAVGGLVGGLVGCGCAAALHPIDPAVITADTVREIEKRNETYRRQYLPVVQAADPALGQDFADDLTADEKLVAALRAALARRAAGAAP